MGPLPALECIANGIGRVKVAPGQSGKSPGTTTLPAGVREVTRSAEVFAGDAFEDLVLREKRAGTGKKAPALAEEMILDLLKKYKMDTSNL